MSNWNQEMLKSKMTELAHHSQIEMKALGDYVNKQFEELFNNNKEHEESVENFKKLL